MSGSSGRRAAGGRWLAGPAGRDRVGAARTEPCGGSPGASPPRPLSGAGRGAGGSVAPAGGGPDGRFPAGGCRSRGGPDRGSDRGSAGPGLPPERGLPASPLGPRGAAPRGGVPRPAPPRGAGGRGRPSTEPAGAVRRAPAGGVTRVDEPDRRVLPAAGRPDGRARPERRPRRVDSTPGSIRSSSARRSRTSSRVAYAPSCTPVAYSWPRSSAVLETIGSRRRWVTQADSWRTTSAALFGREPRRRSRSCSMAARHRASAATRQANPATTRESPQKTASGAMTSSIRNPATITAGHLSLATSNSTILAASEADGRETNRRRARPLGEWHPRRG